MARARIHIEYRFLERTRVEQEASPRNWLEFQGFIRLHGARKESLLEARRRTSTTDPEPESLRQSPRGQEWCQPSRVQVHGICTVQRAEMLVILPSASEKWSGELVQGTGHQPKPERARSTVVAAIAEAA